jgi:hypothetical protein
MDRRQRLTLLGIAAAIAVAAVVIALVAGGGDDGDETTPNTTAAQTETAGGDTTQDTTATETTPPEPPEPEPTRIRVKGGEPVGGVEKIELEKGDRAMIDVNADAADHAHLHGYDIEKDVGPGTTAKFRFKADIEGVFELELHDSGGQIAELTVKP